MTWVQIYLYRLLGLDKPFNLSFFSWGILAAFGSSCCQSEINVWAFLFPSQYHLVRKKRVLFCQDISSFSVELIQVSFFFIIVLAPFLFEVLTVYQMSGYQGFSLILRSTFSFVWWVPLVYGNFFASTNSTCLFLPLLLRLWCFSQKPTNFCSPQQRVASLFFPLRVHTLCLILKSLYNFGLIFVCSTGKRSNFILLPLEIQFSLCTYWRDCPVSIRHWCLAHGLVNHGWVDVFSSEPTGIQP